MLVLKSIKSVNRIFWAKEYCFKALECQISWTNTKPLFWESDAKLQTFPKLSVYIGVSYKLVLKFVKSLNLIFWVIEYWFKALECQISWTNTKPFFWESEAKLQTLPKLSVYIGVSYKLVLKSVKSLNPIFWTKEYWFKALECQIWSTNTKPFFWESETNLGTLQKLPPNIGVSYKFVLKSVKTLNRYFWAKEYWFKALECQICSTNTKPFFWESETNLGTFRKLSHYIGVSYKFVSKSVKSLNWIFRVIEYWFKALEYKICWTNRKRFFWESQAKLETLQKSLPILDFPINLFWSLSKS